MAAPTIVTGILTGGSNNHLTTSEEVNAVATDFISEGVVGTITNTSGVAPMTGAFAVNASGTPDTNINISTGVAYVTATPTSQNSQALRVKATVSGTLAISANSSGSTKYDWIYISVSAANAANPAVGADDVATIVASRSTSASTDDGTPPTYGYPIAVVTVANGFSTITNGNIRDVRTNSTVNLGSSSVSSGWLDLGYNPNTVTANGNKSYDLVFNSTDLTSTLSKGMRLKCTRLATAPTLCADLESSSSQYFNKTSPSGMTFTDDFVVSAWVKLESYGNYAVASRYNGTSGWILYVSSTGQIQMSGYNGGAANESYVKSYQSIPLGKWVHVAAQLDMSAFTATPTTSYVMIDGVDVPALVSRVGTNPTALIQAGDFQISGFNGANQPFDGKLAQVAVYSAKVTQANIRATISQGLTGSETSLISAYSFNNSISDLSANANNLTAQNSAAATNNDSPFAGGATGTTEYAIITAAAFSTNTTLTVQVPEGYALPTTGGISAVSYSTQDVPFGFPRSRRLWTLRTLVRTNDTQSSPTGTTWYNLGPTSGTAGGQQINIPVGEWVYGYETNVLASRTGSSDGLGCMATLSTANNSESDTDMSGRAYLAVASAVNGAIGGLIKREKPLATTSATLYYLNYRVGTVGAASAISTNASSSGDTVIYAINAYV